MPLSSDLVSQFVKVTNDNKQDNAESTVYGTVVKQGDSLFVRLDGSNILTPVSSSTTMKAGDRVIVTIKNHTATVTGNLTSPAARDEDVKTNSSKLTKLEDVVAYRLTVDDLKATTAIIDSLTAKLAKFSELDAVKVDAESLKATFATLQHVNADNIKAINVAIENLGAKVGNFEHLLADDFEAVQADITNLKAYTGNFTYVSADVLNAMKGSIDDLDAKKLSAQQADIKFANIDFSNIGEAAIRQLYASSGVIKNVIFEDGHITGELVGVTIKGDLIEGGTVIADKLVIKGEDGLYYKLNTTGTSIESEQTDYNSLNGSIITAKSITASKVNVSDLVAFDATIGGFKITEDSIYSGVKESVNNTTRGVYLDNDGQICFGDDKNFVAFYKSVDGKYKLKISAEEIQFGSEGMSLNDAFDAVYGRLDDATADVEDASKTATNYIKADDNGLIVSRRASSSDPGKNILIDGEKIAIRNGTTELARFEAAKLSLGIGNEASTIDLINGNGSIDAFYRSNQFYDEGGITIRGRNYLTCTTNDGLAYIGLGVSALVLAARKDDSCRIAVGGHRNLQIGENPPEIDLKCDGWIYLDSKKGVILSDGEPYHNTLTISSSGLISKSGCGGTWIGARDRCIINSSSYGETSGSSYKSVMGVKTTNGHWTIGNLSGNEGLYFSYTTDANYTKGANQSANFTIGTDGTFSGKATPTSHTHDDRYYTESEVDTKLSGKAAASHTHSYLPLSGGTMTGAITWANKGNNKIYGGPNDAANAVGGALNNLVFDSWYGVSFTTNCSNQTYTGKNAVSINCRSGKLMAASIDEGGTALASKYAAKSHTHDDRYYTESEVDTKLNGKANSSHTHSYLPLTGGSLTGTISTTGAITSEGAKTAVSGAANARVTSTGTLRTASSSSRRYKTDIEDLSIDDIRCLYDLPVHTYVYLDDYLLETDERYKKRIPGFIAEELNDILPIAVDHNDGKAEMWNSNIIVPAMMRLIQDLNHRLEKLEKSNR